MSWRTVLVEDGESLRLKLDSIVIEKQGKIFTYVSSYLDRVCFVLLNQGMGYFEYQSLEVEKVNTLELNFLRNHLYK